MRRMIMGVDAFEIPDLGGMEELCGLYERSNDISTFSKGIEYFDLLNFISVLEIAI